MWRQRCYCGLCDCTYLDSGWRFDGLDLYYKKVTCKGTLIKCFEIYFISSLYPNIFVLSNTL